MNLSEQQVNYVEITLFLANKLVTFKLPADVSGSYSFDVDSKEESKLINIEAEKGTWILYETSDVKIIGNNSRIQLNSNTFYILKRNNINQLYKLQ